MTRSGKTWMGALAVLALAQTTAMLHPAAAQDTPPTADEINTHYSLYWEHFKNGNYEDALSDLRWSLENAPESPYNDDRNFERGVITYDSLAARADDPALQRAHLDSALVLFDRAVATLSARGARIDVFKWTLDKGRFIQEHLDAFPEAEDETVASYVRAYRLDPMRLHPYYFGVILNDLLSKEKYDEALDLLSDLEEQRGSEPEIQAVLDKYYALIPLETLADFWQQRYQANPGDIAIAQRLVSIFIELERWDDLLPVCEDLIALEPTPELLMLAARIYLQNGDYARALALYDDLLAMPEAEPMAELSYNMGFAEHQLDNLIPARTHYRQAIALDPAFGKAYLAIGDLYVAAVSQCAGTTLERRDKAVYWLAVDWWKKARQAAPSDAAVVNEATLKIDTYRQYFLKPGEIFFAGWTVGQSLAINYGCYSWIGETTTVRAS